MSEKFLNLGDAYKKEYTPEEMKHINDTKEHIEHVSVGVGAIMSNLHKRREVHDASKLVEPELTAFAVYGAELGKLKYGSEEYFKALNSPNFKVGIDHHYAVNSHHPEYHVRGILDMSLLDILEMMADWRAASLRTDKGNYESSLEYNRKRFNIPDDIFNLILKTSKELGWI